MLRRPTPGFEGLRNAAGPRDQGVARARELVSPVGRSERPATLADAVSRALDKDGRR